MIFGTGCDIAKISRFEKWVASEDMIPRFFNEAEMVSSGNKNFLCAHYAKRFAAKEAFSKALGTGFAGLELKDFWIENNEAGRPEMKFGTKTAGKLESLAGKNYKVHVTLSDEREYAVAFVVIEKGEDNNHDV